MPKKLASFERQYIIKQLVLGSPYSVITAGFKEKYGRFVNQTTITRIKKDHAPTIQDGKNAIVDETTTSAANIIQQGYQLAHAELAMALEDMEQVRDLRRQLQAEKISPAEFKRKIAFYERKSLSELAKITDSMYSQSKGDDETPASPHDQAALAALMAGIQAGNPVQLIQVMDSREVENQEA